MSWLAIMFTGVENVNTGDIAQIVIYYCIGKTKVGEMRHELKELISQHRK